MIYRSAVLLAEGDLCANLYPLQTALYSHVTEMNVQVAALAFIMTSKFLLYCHSYV